MLTRIEMQYMNAVIGIHDEIRKANERGVDWDALRNQAAVAAMQGTITILGSSDRSAFREVVVEGFGGAKKTFPNEIAQFAVACADSLIAELKKEANAELSQPVTKSGDKGFTD